MSEIDCYLDIANKSLESASLVTDAGTKTFLAYHAAESACSAYVVYFGDKVSTDHVKKFNQMISRFRNIPNKKLRKSVISKIGEFQAIRSRSLYPTNSNGWISPSICISDSDASEYLRKARFVLQTLLRIIN